MDEDLYKDSRLVKELKYSDFKMVKDKIILNEDCNLPIIINFYLPSCKHCKKIVRLWNEMSIRFNNDFKFYSINCDDVSSNNDLLCKKLTIKEYPTILYSLNNTSSKYEKYRGRVTKDDLFYFISFYL